MRDELSVIARLLFPVTVNDGVTNGIRLTSASLRGSPIEEVSSEGENLGTTLWLEVTEFFDHRFLGLIVVATSDHPVSALPLEHATVVFRERSGEFILAFMHSVFKTSLKSFSDQLTDQFAYSGIDLFQAQNPARLSPAGDADSPMRYLQ